MPIVSSNFSRHVDSSAAQREYPELETAIGITTLPDELIVKILSNLNIKDISVCRRINSSWQALVDTNHLLALSFSRRLRFRPISQTAKNYHSFTRGWLTGFSKRGKELAQQLDNFLGNKHFPEILFFNIAELLTKTKLLICQNVCTVQHPHFLGSNPIFSPDGNHIATATDDYTAQIWELVARQLQHRATIEHHNNQVFNVSFSPDGSHLVIALNFNAGKIWGLVAGQWREKATIPLSRLSWIDNASFSPDGSHLVTTSGDTANIWGLVGGQWKKKAALQHSDIVRSACFSRDGIHLLTLSGESITKIWLLAGC